MREEKEGKERDRKGGDERGRLKKGGKEKGIRVIKEREKDRERDGKGR